MRSNVVLRDPSSTSPLSPTSRSQEASTRGLSGWIVQSLGLPTHIQSQLGELDELRSQVHTVGMPPDQVVKYRFLHAPSVYLSNAGVCALSLGPLFP